MRRSFTTMAAVAATTLSVLIGTGPAAHADRDAHDPAVTGTFSAGATHTWQPLPAVRTDGAASGPVDATVAADPTALRQKYEGIGFSLDETSVSNLWKLTPVKRREAVQLLVAPVHGRQARSAGGP